MQQTRLSSSSQNLLFNLKQFLLRYTIDLKKFIFKCFGQVKASINDHQFQSIFRKVDERISFYDIDQLFNQLQNKMIVNLDALEKQLILVKKPDLMPARFQLDTEIKENLLKSLKQVQIIMLKEDPYYVFDIYDYNKDERLQIEQLNDLLMGCSKVLARETQLRSQAIKCLLRYANRRSISRKSFFQIFGFKNISPKIRFGIVPSVQQVQDDDQIFKKCVMSSKLYSSKSSIQSESSVMKSIVEIPIPNPQLNAMRYFIHNDYHKYSQMIGLLEFYINNDQVFVDPQGPKNGNKKYVEKRAQVIFKNKQFHLFQMAESVLMRQQSRIGLAQLIQPKDIIQGSIGDCYFLSSISSIVWRYPQHIMDLFLFQVNPAGLYVVRLFNDGEWGNIVLDDKFPCDKNDVPAFARPHTNQIWVMLLEKAWAKINISYENIDLGSSLQGLVALTGAPCKYYRKEDEQVMDKIKQAWDKKWITTCSGSEYLNQMKKQDTNKLGLIGKHAYSVLKLIDVVDPHTGQKLTLIRMRNPWGDLQWKGDWSFNSAKWTPQLRQKHNYKNNPNDGSFFMPWKEFQKYFGSVTVCSMILGNVNSSLKINVKRHKSTFVEMKIIQSGNYTISLYQQSKRKYKHSQNYKLSQSRLIIMQQLPKKGKQLSYLQYIASGNKSTSNVHLSIYLQKGTYFVSAKVAWRNFQEHYCVVASYGPKPVDFQLFQDRSISKYFKQHLINSYFQKNRGNKTHYTNIKLNEAYREVCVNLDNGIGYIFFGNPTSSTFKSTINFKNAKGIKLIKPYAFPLEVQIKPDTQSLYGMFISGEGYSYVMQQKVKLLK